jgi:phosphoglycolate phosphatase-like HAD superfamily hydrolase
VKNIKAIIWDFDGVILMSEMIRQKGFRILFEDFKPEQIERLIDFHKENGGLSRYVKIRYFYEDILGSDISEDEVMELAGKFSVIMRNELTNPELLNQEWLQLMKSVGNKLDHYIASGSDQEELRFLCSKLGIRDFFKGIFGSPVAKIENVGAIMKHNYLGEGEVVLIGDAYNDYEAATKNDIQFLGYNNESLRPHGHAYLKSLEQVKSFI